MTVRTLSSRVAPTRAHPAAGSLQRLAVLAALGLAAALRAGPIFMCDPAAVDLGKLEPTDKPVAEFRIQNTGDEPLLLTKARAGCAACMTIECPDKPVPAGAVAALKVTLTGLPPSGPVRKIVYLSTNDPAKAGVVLTVSGSVCGVYALTPNPTFALGETEAGKEQSWDYELTITGATSCAITAVEAPPGIAIRAALNRSAQRHALRLTTVTGKLAAGFLQGEVALRTDSPALPLLRIPLALLVRGPVMPLPSTLLVGIPPKGGVDISAMSVFPPTCGRLVLVCSRASCPGIEAVGTPSADVHARALPAAAEARSQAVEVTIEPGAEPGMKGDLIVRLAGSDLPPVRVPVVAVRAGGLPVPADESGQMRAAAQTPLPFDVLLARLGDHLGCKSGDFRTGGFKDERTQLAIWLAERLCDPATVERQARRSTLGGMSVIEYARARDEVTLRLQRDPAFKIRCEETLVMVGPEETGEAGK